MARDVIDHRLQDRLPVQTIHLHLKQRLQQLETGITSLPWYLARIPLDHETENLAEIVP